MRVHHLKLHRRRRLVAVLVLLLVGVASPMTWVLTTGSAPDLPDWVMLVVAIPFFALFIWALIPIEVELRVEGDAVVVRRRGRVLKQIRRPTTRFVPFDPGNGRAGSVVEIRGEGGTLRVGAAGHHPREDLPYEGPGVRSLQSWVADASALDALLVELRGERARGAVTAPVVTRFEVPLRVQGTSIRGAAPALLVSFAPILTMAAGGAVLALISEPGADIPEWLAAVAIVSYVPTGLLAWRLRPSRPRFFLRVDGLRVELLDASRRPIARADDARTRIEGQWHWSHRRWTGPAIALRFDQQVIELGCLVGDWPASRASGRAPRWAVGTADFALLRATWNLSV